VTAVGYKFSLVLSREVTEAESAALLKAARPTGDFAGVVFATDSLPTNAEITVTKIDFDDTVSPSLAEAIESALEAVKTIPDLSVPGLTVPAQPAEGGSEQVSAVSAPEADSQAKGDAQAKSDGHATHAGNGAGSPNGDLVGVTAGSGRAQEK
jgi:hypothetical protein